ncbi:MAG: hypothetical protein CK604_07140 [Curvibacter sp. PD_MW3]|nr:MAG: hypothetical protein CK604_07140 [Curvibacter sp. PD_MW3]
MIEKNTISAGTVRPMTDDEQLAAARARSERLFREHQDYVDEARAMAPTWSQFADESTEALFDPAVCELLADTAPLAHLKSFYQGKASVLREIQALTGRTV